MLEDYQEFNKRKFLEDFKRKFNNVLKKAPIQARVKVIENDVFIEVNGYKNNPIKYTFDFSIPLKRNIFLIREELKKLTFPIIEKEFEIEEDYSPEEVEKLIYDKHYNVEDALNAKKIIKSKKKFRLERVIIDRDEVFIEDLDTQERKRYRLIGISFFLYGLRNGKFNASSGGNYFFSKAQFLNDILPEKEWNNSYKYTPSKVDRTNYVTIEN